MTDRTKEEIAAYEEGRRQAQEDAWEAGYTKGFTDGWDTAVEEGAANSDT
jgi:flagellar biosynthesis/type III secretory pathway protein FliH